jgi:hypothetical protein
MNDNIGFKKGDKVVCIDNRLIEDVLTIGKVYKVFLSFGDSIKVRNSDELDIYYNYSCSRFVSLQDYRKLKLEKLERIGNE